MALDPTATTAPDGYVRVGRLGRTFQLDGGLRLRLEEAVSYDTDDSPEPVGVRAVRSVGSVFVTGMGSSGVRSLGRSGGELILKLDAARERNGARLLVNQTVWLDPSSLPSDLRAELLAELEAGTDEDQIVGLPVIVDGQEFGVVTEATLSGNNPVLTVTPGGSGHRPDARPSLLPLLAPYVELTPSGVVVTDPPPGLLTDD